MSILSWDKPKRARSKEAHAQISADGAPPGVYVPNMSQEDQLKWKAKLVGVKTGHPQVEIRRTHRGNGLVIIVSLGGGYSYKYYKREETKGLNIHIASSGPQQMTFQDFEDMIAAVNEAKEVLEKTHRIWYEKGTPNGNYTEAD